jgi:2-dehydropantoate 2-reductase
VEKSTRILVVGAGAIGGYFGGRLLAAGRDVTFLVRPRRAAELVGNGLAVRSVAGDLDIAAPPVVSAEKLSGYFDLVLLSAKAYDLEGAMDSFAPAVGPATLILPVLNGMRHMDTLKARFGAEHVLGGVALISTVLDPQARIVHLNDLHTLSFGEMEGGRSPRVDAIAAAFSGANFDSRLSEIIQQEMWEKWVLIAAGAGITCLMRGAVGDIAAAGGGELATSLLDECGAIAARQGFPPRAFVLERGRTIYTTPGSPFTASMFRDIEQRAPIEAEHIIGDLLRRGAGEPDAYPLLRIAYIHLKTYEARRAREADGSSK